MSPTPTPNCFEQGQPGSLVPPTPGSLHPGTGGAQLSCHWWLSPPFTTSHVGSGVELGGKGHTRAPLAPWALRPPVLQQPVASLTLRTERTPDQGANHVTSPPTTAAATPFPCNKQEAYFQQKMFLSKEPASVPVEATSGRAPRRPVQVGPQRRRCHSTGSSHAPARTRQRGPKLKVPHTDLSKPSSSTHTAGQGQAPLAQCLHCGPENGSLSSSPFQPLRAELPVN